MPGLPAEIFSDRFGVIQDGFGKGVAGDQSIAIGEGEPCVFNGVERDFDTQFTRALVWDNTNGTLCHANQCVFTSQCLRFHMV